MLPISDCAWAVQYEHVSESPNGMPMAASANCIASGPMLDMLHVDSTPLYLWFCDHTHKRCKRLSLQLRESKPPPPTHVSSEMKLWVYQSVTAPVLSNSATVQAFPTIMPWKLMVGAEPCPATRPPHAGVSGSTQCSQKPNYRYTHLGVHLDDQCRNVRNVVAAIAFTCPSRTRDERPSR